MCKVVLLSTVCSVIINRAKACLAASVVAEIQYRDLSVCHKKDNPTIPRLLKYKLRKRYHHASTIRKKIFYLMAHNLLENMAGRTWPLFHIICPVVIKLLLVVVNLPCFDFV